MTPEQIAALRELEKKAKRTPWEVSCADILAPDPNRDNRLQALVCGCEQGTASVVDDFEFICAIRNAAKELLDAAEENARLREALEFYASEENEVTVMGDAGTEGDSWVCIDKGDRARRALGIEGGGK